MHHNNIASFKTKNKQSIYFIIEISKFVLLVGGLFHDYKTTAAAATMQCSDLKV